MVRRTAHIVIASGGLWLALGLAARVTAEESAAAQAGHNLYEEHCYVCHGLRAQGDGPLAEELKVAPADLTKIAQRRGGVFPQVELREIIDGRRKLRGHGPANMPIWGKVFANQTAGALREDQVRDKVDSLVEYLLSIQNPVPTSPVKH